MNERRIDAIFFDLGRVVVDFDHFPIAQKLLETAVEPGFLHAEEVFQWLFHPSRGVCCAFDSGKISPEGFYREICEKFGLSISFLEFTKIWNDIFSENEEVTEMVKELSGNIPLYVISNTNSLHFEYIAERFPVLELFDARILSYKEGVCKPEEKIFRAALSRSGTEPDRSVYIDDIEAFIRAAEGLGFNGIHFTSAQALKDRLTDLLPYQFSK
jgi:putative hydrolase of the HAD superfamily